MKRIVSPDGKRFTFYCPACKGTHVFNHTWQFNGDYERPTVSPSIKVTGVVPLTDEDVAKIMRNEPFEPTPLCCHSFITDGRIAYCSDCTHAMSGQTVELPEITESQAS